MEDNKTMMPETGKHPTGCQCGACKGGMKNCGCGGKCGCGGAGKMVWCWVAGLVVFLLIIVLVFFAGLRIGTYQGAEYSMRGMMMQDGNMMYGRSGMHPMMNGQGGHDWPMASSTSAQ